MYSDANPDYIKMTLLNLPAALLVSHWFQPSLNRADDEESSDQCMKEVAEAALIWEGQILMLQSGQEALLSS